jgi:copper chaperone CopZ
MNRLWSHLGALVLTVSVGWAGEPATTTLKVEGMTCGGCVAAVKVQLKRTEGVTAYEVRLEKAEAEVSYDPAKITPEKIAESVSKTGFKASVKGAKDEGSGAKQGAVSPLDLNALKDWFNGGAGRCEWSRSCRRPVPCARAGMAS